jgi:endonuclease/exonuclease/phosphatase family metal-dependent hydrolase
VNPVAVTGRSSFTLLAVSTWNAPTYKKALLNGLEAYRDLPRPFVVAGDFNGNTCFDRPRGRSKWADCFRQVEQLGTFSAYHSWFDETYGSESRPTYYFRWAQARPFHIDYCFVPLEWRERLRHVSVGEYEEWRKLSDHRPIIVDTIADT